MAVCAGYSSCSICAVAAAAAAAALPDQFALKMQRRPAADHCDRRSMTMMLFAQLSTEWLHVATTRGVFSVQQTVAALRVEVW